METQTVAFDGPRPWTDEAERALSGTFANDIGRMRVINGVRSGKLELWNVCVNLQECGVLVTERLKDEIFVWCYQGREFFLVSRALAAVAVHNRMRAVGWFTFHRGAVRRYRRFSPEVTDTRIPGEMRFRLNAEGLAHGNR